jgi:DNA-binding transcriptional ArsR family regulator
MNQATTDRILFALFCLSRDTRHIDATELASLAGVSPTVAGQALVLLERAGLVDATRARLTMLGLARAAKLAATSGGQPRLDLRHVRPRKVRVAAPLAAAAEQPRPDDAGALDRSRVRGRSASFIQTSWHLHLHD